MPDRLAELRRQRALVAQHLEWLDREIAAEAARQSKASTITAPASAAAPAATTTPVTPASSAASTLASAGNPETDRILDEYRVAPGRLHNDVRKGCFLYFAAALALFVAVVAILYFTLTHR